MIENSVDRFNGVIASKAIKVPCVVASNVNITLSGEQTVNGVAVVSGDRVLVAAQTAGAENGIYNASATAWARAADWDGNRDVAHGTTILVGLAAGSQSLYEVLTADPIVIGSSATTFGVLFAGGGSPPNAGTVDNSTLRWDSGGGAWVQNDVVKTTTTGGLIQEDTINPLTVTHAFDASENFATTFFGTGPADVQRWRVLGLDNITGAMEVQSDFEITGNKQIRVYDNAGTSWMAILNVGGICRIFSGGIATDIELQPSNNGSVIAVDAPLAITDSSLNVAMQVERDLNDVIVTFPVGGGGSRDYVIDSAGQLTGVMRLGLPLNLTQNPVQDFTIKHQVVSSAATILTVNYALGQSVLTTLTENIATFTINNWPATDLAQIEFEIIQDSVARTVAWPAAVQWIGGVAPDLSNLSSRNLVRLRTRNGGTNIMGTFGENFS